MKRQGEIREIKKGSFLIMDDHPCKVNDVQISAPGKHGHAKARITGMSLFDNSKHTTISPTHAKCDIPIIDKKQAQVLSISGNKAHMMDLESYETFELEFSEEDAEKIEPNKVIEYWMVLGKKLLMR